MPEDLANNPEINYPIANLIASYNWDHLAYGFDSDFKRIIQCDPRMAHISSLELMGFCVRSLLTAYQYDRLDCLRNLFLGYNSLITESDLYVLSRVVDLFLDNNARELIRTIAKQQILDYRDSSQILLHFLTIPEIERFYGSLITYGFPSVILATCYMICELALVCYSAYCDAYSVIVHHKALR